MTLKLLALDDVAELLVHQGDEADDGQRIPGVDRFRLFRARQRSGVQLQHLVEREQEVLAGVERADGSREFMSLDDALAKFTH